MGSCGGVTTALRSVPDSVVAWGNCLRDLGNIHVSSSMMYLKPPLMHF